MPLTDTLIVIAIILLLILLIWSRVMQQTVLDTLYEVKEFVNSFKKVEE